MLAPFVNLREAASVTSAPVIVVLAIIFLTVWYLLKRFLRQRRTSCLANATILIIRHSEKPAAGRLLNREGRNRAHAYAHYFVPFEYSAQSLTIDTLIAAADSKRSMRPRLTLEPLSRATGLPLNASFSSQYSQALARHLLKNNRGKVVLICWRHNQIPVLLSALGAEPEQLLPAGKWPTQTYDWVILLRYDARGKLIRQERIQQPDPLL